MTETPDPWASRSRLLADAYPADYLAKLGAELGFDPTEPGVAEAIRLLGRRYLADKTLDDDGAVKATGRAGYRRLEREAARLLEVLDRPDYAELAGDIHTIAKALREPEPRAEPSNLGGPPPDHGEAYLWELRRLLRLLEITANRYADRLAPPKGRPASFSLDNFVRRAMDVWTGPLGRALTVDHHKGAGLTPSIAFVRALLAPLDPEVSETRIVTAMRAEQRRRRELARELGTD